MNRKTILSITGVLVLSLFSVRICQSEENEYDYPLVINEIGDKFSYRYAVVLRDDIWIRYRTLNRNDELTIVDEDDDFYYFDYEGVILATGKSFIRTEKEQPFKEYEGYTRSGSVLYADDDLSDRIRTFKVNEKVRVIDEFAGISVIDTEDGLGYMKSASISRNKIPTYVAPAPSSSPSIDPVPSTPGDSSSGGSYEPSPAPSSPTPSSGDGEDIVLAFHEYEHPSFMLEDSEKYKAIVLKNNTVSYIGRLNRGDQIKVLEADDEEAVVLVSGRKGRIEKKYIRFDDEEGYSSWQGYSRSGVGIYSDFYLQKRIKSCRLNETINVVDEVDGVYVIELADGTTGYMARSSVSEKKISTYTAPSPAQVPTQDPGSGGSSDSSPAPSPSPSPSPEPSQPEWTEPVL